MGQKNPISFFALSAVLPYGKALALRKKLREQLRSGEDEITVITGSTSIKEQAFWLEGLSVNEADRVAFSTVDVPIAQAHMSFSEPLLMGYHRFIAWVASGEKTEMGWFLRMVGVHDGKLLKYCVYDTEKEWEVHGLLDTDAWCKLCEGSATLITSQEIPTVDQVKAILGLI